MIMNCIWEEIREPGLKKLLKWAAVIGAGIFFFCHLKKK